jgi:HEPN domain-containing protein
MKKGTREWIRKAESDYRLAVRTAGASEPFHDQVCFLCQQSAEKYLKSLLAEQSVPIPRTHNLDDLRALVAPYYAPLIPLRRGLIFLTRFSVDMRYPPERATKRQAQSALRWAAKIRDACRPLLGLRPPTQR